MDKYYSKNSKIYKAVFSLMLAPLYMLLSYAINTDDGFLDIILSVIPIGCLYTVPFWISLAYIKKYRVERLGKYIALDALITLMPAIFGILFSEIIVTLINGTSSANGFSTVVFSSLYIIVSLIFWLLYFVFSKIK